MSFSMVNGITTIHLDAIGTLALALVLLLLGNYLRNHVSFLERFCIPAPVAGGFTFSFIHCILYMAGILCFEFDTAYQSPAMIAFFTCVGLATSVKGLKKGGKDIVVYYVLCCVLVTVQSILSIVLSFATGIEPIYGFLAGSTTMVGGHGNGGSFGQTITDMGYAAGLTVGMACATFGLVSVSLLGGPFANHLIKKFKLDPSRADTSFDEPVETLDGEVAEDHSNLNLMKHIAHIAVIMTIGGFIVAKISNLINGVTLPAYVGGMFLGVIVRNVNEKTKLIHFNQRTIDGMQDVFLAIFLSIAMMSLKLWQLIDLAIPLLIILFAQVAFIILFARFICFPLLGKTYDTAVMLAGMIGHGLGATPNAIANITSVTSKYGPSKKAMFIVPIIAAAFLDLYLLPAIVVTFNVAVNLMG